MASKVWHWDLRASRRLPYEQRIRKLLKAADGAAHVTPGDLAALKLHFGEAGTTAFIQPLWLRPVIDVLKEAGAKPFLTDSNTLYVGARGESVSHAMTAARHGFDAANLGAPVIIADGLKGEHYKAVPFEGKHIREAYLAGDVLAADVLVVLSHFKGHELAGFGGALKNVAMGCAARRGKMHQHACTGPEVKSERCTGCGACVEVCAAGALVMGEPDEAGKRQVRFDRERCAGCAACFLACRTGGLEIDWRTNVQEFLERMMEYAAACLLSRPKPTLFLNFVAGVTPDCDCIGFSDAPLCPDLGVLCSFDPVALDQACLDLVNAAPPLWPSKLPRGLAAGENKFKAAHPHVPDNYGLDHAVAMGLGSREYELTTL